MHLDDWLLSEGRGALTKLHYRAGVSFPTLLRARDRKPMTRREIARAISDATDGKVTVSELLDPAPLDPAEVAQ